MDPKALEMSIHVDPKNIGRDCSVLADFKLLWSPFRVEGCKLVQTPNGYTVYMPDRSVRITQQGLEAVVAAAVEVFEGAMAR